MVRIALAGGGTAGHVNPLLATAKALRKKGCEIIVFGTKEGMESTLVPAAGFEMVTIPRVPLPRKPSPALFSLPSRLHHAVAISMQALKNVDAVIGFGGYVSLPVYRAATKLSLPFIVQEQNMRPGIANRIGARNATCVALTFPSTVLHAHRGQVAVTGLPLREEIVDIARAMEDPVQRKKIREDAASRLGINPDLRTLVLTGGSLGAQSLNAALCGAAPSLPEDIQIVHLTGRGKAEKAREIVTQLGFDDRWVVMEYLSEMQDALAVADLVMSRAGAGTVAELTLIGIPAIYVPLPIGNGEQRLNAHDHVEAGGAFLVEDSALSPRYVRDTVFPLLGSEKLQEMADASRGISPRDAAGALADIALQCARGAFSSSAVSERGARRDNQK